MSSNGNILSESNQRWALGGTSIIITLALTLGGSILSSQQTQIEKNQEKIWGLQSTAVTDDKLNRQIQQVQDYIDVRIQSLESSQREMARQLTVLVNDTKESRKETMDAIGIGTSLSTVITWASSAFFGIVISPMLL